VTAADTSPSTNPSTGAATPAGVGFGRRFAALLYDSFLLLALLMIYTGVSIVFTPGHVAVTQEFGAWWYVYRAGELAVIGGYYLLNWIHSGQTLGMRAWRIKVVQDDGRPMTTRAGLLRFAFGFIAWPPAALGVLWLYFDTYHAAIHDRLSKTRVIRV
jgi:uncharacterized RDD family membrane protein YckC